ncbi:MAG: hypothetical protein EOO23_08875 [Comamonadaceae bacterium]|nr:MAG: hypothetical protein EOO23_08875 [Comamonadaceae bacterium]
MELALQLSALVIILGIGYLAFSFLREPQEVREGPAVALDDAQIQQILKSASASAVVYFRKGERISNPFREGSRAHILWETQFQRDLMDLQDGTYPARQQH